VRELADLLRDEIDRTLHPSQLAVLVSGTSPGVFTSIDDDGSALDEQSMLVQLLYSVRASIQINLESSGPIARLLPETDRQWLLDRQARVLVPLFGSAYTLLGVIAFSENKGGFAIPSGISSS
jgi:hypothetical protein